MSLLIREAHLRGIATGATFGGPRQASLDLRTALMPYEVSFTKRVPINDREDYINECCVGGDAVRDRLLPAVRARYGDVDTNQEDWGWFIWFRQGHVNLAIDIFTDDPDEGAFRIHLTSRTKRLLLFDQIVDTPELDELRALVVTDLSEWVGRAVQVAPISADSEEP